MATLSTAATAAYGITASLSLLTLLRVGRSITQKRAKIPRDDRSPAERMVLAGDVLAVLLVAAGSVRSNALGLSVTHDVLSVAIMALTGLALVQLAGALGVRALLGSHLPTELSRNNLAAGLAAGAHYASMGILARHAVSAQDWRGWGLSLVFFALSVALQLGAVTLFRALTTYDDDEHIRGGNLAAALSYAGVSIASALMISRAVEGDFTTWARSLASFAGMSAWVLLLFPVRQIIVQGLLFGAAPSMRGGALDDAIAQNRDVGASTLESLAYLALALAWVALS